MVRKKRIIYPGYCYHVMLHGVGGRNIFNDNQDRARFCLLLQYASETYNFGIHGFCLMNNHVHLLLQVHTADLSSGMHSLAFRYAQYFNKKIDQQGYLFQSRYKAIGVQNGVYLQRLLRYIHRNPIRANLVKNLSDYFWSSHLAYEGYSDFTWLKRDLLLSSFHTEPDIALKLFQKYVLLNDAESKIELEEIRSSVGIGAYGNNLFIEKFSETLEVDSNEQKELSLDHRKEINLEIIVNALNETTFVSFKEIQSPSKKEHIVDARAIFVCLVLRFKLGDTIDLAKLLNRDVSSIIRLKQRAQQSPILNELSNRVIANLP
jgi:putative transposase